MPQMFRPVAWDLCIRAASACTTMVNNRGNRLSPCLPPPVSSKEGVRVPFIIKGALVSIKPSWIQVPSN